MTKKTPVKQEDILVKKRLKYLEVQVPVSTKIRFDSPALVYGAFKHDIDPFQEELWVVVLNPKLRIIKRFLVSKGDENSVRIRPSNIFRTVLMTGATRFMICHSHPSGDSDPSADDNYFTEKIKEGSALLGLSFIDHVIFTDEQFYSYERERKL
jgi:DNA repair protein RadC